jgi:hypothetical protein
MKKSEAIEKLVEILQEYENCMLNKKAARQILNKIEKEIGMLPPFVDGVRDVDNYVKLVVSQAAYAGHCKWEKTK